MKLKYIFEKLELDDLIAAVPVGEGSQNFRGMLRLNETASAILDLLKEDTTEEAVVEAILKEYEGDKDEIAQYVHEYIEELVEAEIVER